MNGEKAADRGAAELGIATTCTPDGEGKWWGEHTKALLGKSIRIVTDRDEKGELYGKVVSEALVRQVAEVKIIRLPGLPPKGDLWDWIEAGGSRDQLNEIVANTLAMELPSASTDTPEPHLEASQPVEHALLKQLRNDTGNADRLILKFGDRLRYCPGFKKWLVWDGRRRAVDGRGAARRLAKKTMLEYLAQAVDAEDKDHRTFAYRSLDAKRIGNLLTMAECELVITPDQLDTHPFLLNFLNGTLNLETGVLLPHDSELYITKLVHYNYNPQAECPLFLGFIARIMGNHADASEPELDRAERMVEYLKRSIGYSLSGTTEEKAVFVPFGSGNNGKTTLLSTFLHLLEEYAVLLQVDTLMVRQESNNTQADLADLRGARFAMTSETEEGQRLSQGKLKRITQGMGKIKATRKYENPIEFPETHKLWMDTNSKPIIRAADDQATFNRLHPIPFTVTIPAEEIDKSLPRKLLAEAEGILAWAVEGALEWRRNGLGKPPEVTAANDDWKAENDQLGRFIEDCCVVGDSVTERRARLHVLPGVGRGRRGNRDHRDNVRPAAERPVGSPRWTGSMGPSMSGSRCAPPRAPRRRSCDGLRRVVGFEGWRVWRVFFITFLHPPVRKGVFEKNPPRPTTTAKPTTLWRRGNSVLRGAGYSRDLTHDGAAAGQMRRSLPS